MAEVPAKYHKPEQMIYIEYRRNARSFFVAGIFGDIYFYSMAIIVQYPVSFVGLRELKY